MSASTAGKKLIIGIDEAGYGPNLGPLLIGASAWLVPCEMTDSRFSEALTEHFRPRPWSQDCQHVPLGDSKKLYHSGNGLTSLETGLLVMLKLLGLTPNQVGQLTKQAAIRRAAPDALLPWYDDLDLLSVPSTSRCQPDEIARLTTIADSALSRLGIEVLAIKALIVTEPEFNQRVGQLNSKGTLLAQVTLELAESLLLDYPGLSAEIYCDRQGGRKNYLPLLLQWKPDCWFTELIQSSQRCSYRSTSSPDLDIHFTVGGDSFPPTALASMVAKYLRERLMESFNCYWSKHNADLKPTAGYPVDAARFRAQIESTALLQSLPVERWWRCR